MQLHYFGAYQGSGLWIVIVNVSQQQYQMMNECNLMFDHIQYCLILGMTLMLQPEPHLTQNLLHWMSNLRSSHEISMRSTSFKIHTDQSRERPNVQKAAMAGLILGIKLNKDLKLFWFCFGKVQKGKIDLTCTDFLKLHLCLLLTFESPLHFHYHWFCSILNS